MLPLGVHRGEWHSGARGAGLDWGLRGKTAGHLLQQMPFSAHRATVAFLSPQVHAKPVLQQKKAGMQTSCL